MKSETAEFAMSQRTNKGGVPNADDWTSEGGVTFAFTNQLESVSSLFTAGRMAAGFIPVVDSIRLHWD